MFMGSYDRRVDDKGRLVLPAKFRQELGPVAICTIGLDGCVAIYSQEMWQALLKKLQDLPFTKEKARRFIRALLAAADEVTIDSAGRILLNGTLKKYAALGESVTIIGVGDHLELWNSDQWAQDQETSLKELASLAEGIEDFGI